MLCFTWLFASPPGSSADDDFHLASIYCTGQHPEICEIDPTGKTATMPTFLFIDSVCYLSISPSSPNAACNMPPNLSLSKTTRFNSDQSRPSIFYNFHSLFVSDELVESVLKIRILNSLIAAILFTFALRMLPQRLRKGFLLTWGLCLIPVGINYITSTNPSSWAITGVGTFWAFALSIAEDLQSGLKMKKLAIIGLFVSATLAISARMETGIYMISIIAGLVFIYGDLKRIKAKQLIAILLFCLAFLPIVIYFVIKRFGEQLDGIFKVDDPFLDLNPFVNALLEMPAYIYSHFGGQGASYILGIPMWAQNGIGWLQIAMPSAVGYLLGGSVFAVVLLALQNLPRRQAAAVLLQVIAFLLTSIGILAIFDFQPGVFLQARYTLPIVIAFIGLLILPISRPWLLSKSQSIAVTIVTGVVGILALLRTLTFYTNGVLSNYLNFSAEPSWWWSNFLPKTQFVIIGIFVTCIWAISFIFIPTRVSDDSDSNDPATSLKLLNQS